MDAYGYCKIDGRIKDMIIRGGENIYPAEIEQFLHTHPKIKEAQVSSGSERQESVSSPCSIFISVEKTRTISLAAEQHVVVFLFARWSEFRMPVWVKRSAPASSWWTDRSALQRKSKPTARAR